MTRQDIERALALERQGRAEESIAVYQGVLERQPYNSEVLSLLGMAHARRGETGKAIPYLQQAKGLRPTDPAAAFNLGVAFLSEGTRDKAIECFAQVLQIDPGFIPAKVNLGALYIGEGRAAEALPLLDDAIARGKVSASTWVNRGIALDLLHRPLEACTAFERASTIDPKDIQALVYLGRAYAGIGDMAKARATYARILERQPGHTEALLRNATAQLEVIYLTTDEIQDSRARYRAATDRAYSVSADIIARTPLPQLQRMFDWAFFLPYQGEAVKDDLVRLGDAICEAGIGWAPAAPSVARSPRRDRLRLGVATAFFWRHSVWKVPTRGWLGNLDRTRFEIMGYHLGTRADEETERAKSLCDTFRAGEKDLTGWARRIAEDQLDVLLYPEIGMDRPTVLLASMRLAPLQMTTWGHPVTSGLRTIDWYLSSDLMEPSDGDAHYAEQLIRLANLSVFYEAPGPAGAALGRGTLGIADDRTVYLCCQNLSKYLPQNDPVFIDIAKTVPGCLFVFIRSGKPSVDGRFERRLRQAFGDAGLPFDRYVCLVPPVTPDAFPSLGALGDVYLDSLEWSGCNTTLEMLANDLPIVTHRGRFMRGRHTAAMLQMMGLEDHIAASVDDYVARAIELGRNPALREACRRAIGQRKERLFYDKSPVQQLETLLTRHVGRS
jgi:protein O-GlcNAc transferase